jgi:hypothetical protein
MEPVSQPWQYDIRQGEGISGISRIFAKSVRTPIKNGYKTCKNLIFSHKKNKLFVTAKTSTEKFGDQLQQDRKIRHY